MGGGGGAGRPGSFGTDIGNVNTVGVEGLGQKLGCEYFGEVRAGYGDRDWGYQYFRGAGAGPVTGIGDVNIVGWGGGRRRKHGRYWDTDIVWVGTEISGCLVNVIDSKNT